MRQMGFCHTCRLQHVAPPNTFEGVEFLMRHARHRVELVDLLLDQDKGWMIPARLGESALGYDGNASVKQSFGTATAFTVTNAGIASSATAGWMGNSITNTSNLYMGAGVVCDFASAAWTAGNQITMFAYSSIDGSVYSSTGDGQITGSEGTVTFPDITSKQILLPVLGIIPCPVTSKQLVSPMMEVSKCFNGVLPPYWGVAMINNSGASLSGKVNSIKYIEFYYTVA